MVLLSIGETEKLCASMHDGDNVMMKRIRISLNFHRDFFRRILAFVFLVMN